jgi:hypothetical protein
MRFFVYLLPLVLLVASSSGCGSKSPADSVPPPGVTKNPHPPDPGAIKARKQMLIDPRTGGVPSRPDGKR